METSKTNHLTIYFAGAIRGGRREQPLYADIVAILKNHGTVVSEHVADEELSAFGETNVAKEEIHSRELDRIKESDAVVAETTTPSLGVGYIIAKARELKKKVICVYNGPNTDKLSAMIKGSPGIIIISYMTLQELEEKISLHLQ